VSFMSRHGLHLTIHKCCAIHTTALSGSVIVPLEQGA
jgi:hypothetical protein